MSVNLPTQFLVASDVDAPAPEWLARLRCPKTKLGGFTTSFVSPRVENGIPRNGYLICESASTVYSVRGGIVNLVPPRTRLPLTVAGWSNHFFPSPQLYEAIWRRRALTFMSGELFPVTREYALLNDWAQVQPGEGVIDLGTSTGLYARGLSDRDATIFAIDLSWGMLREARGYIEREKRRGIVLMRAAAENLPFHDNSMDAVVVGGSFNEMQSIRAAMAEAYRVTRPGGRMFVTSLSQASRWRARVLQSLARLSGIQFPSVNQFNALAQQTGWNIAAQELKGIVLFSLLTKGA